MLLLASPLNAPMGTIPLLVSVHLALQVVLVAMGLSALDATRDGTCQYLHVNPAVGIVQVVLLLTTA